MPEEPTAVTAAPAPASKKKGSAVDGVLMTKKKTYGTKRWHLRMQRATNSRRQELVRMIMMLVQMLIQRDSKHQTQRRLQKEIGKTNL